MGLPSTIQAKRIASDPSDQLSESVLTIKGPVGRINRAVWGPLNKTIISAGEDTVIHVWDAETGQLLKESDKETGHQKTITSLSKFADCSHFLTGSSDKSAKLWVTRTLTLLKTYVTERPVNACAISPLLDHEFDVFWRGLALIFCCLIYYILEAEFVNIIQNMQQNIVKFRNFSYKFLMVYSVSKLGASDIELLRNIRRYYIVEELQMCTSRVKSKRF